MQLGVHMNKDNSDNLLKEIIISTSEKWMGCKVEMVQLLLQILLDLLL
jgi:hypothetical protein